jgi:ferritin-like metal-binding protein YciE
MGLFSKDIQTMDDLFLHGLQDVYYAENQIVKALPKMIDKATNRDLSKGLKDHLGETEKQIGRLDQVFKLLEQKPKGVKCPAIDGIIAEADELAGEVADKQVLDAAIVGSAQAVEHYEIARYGTLIAWADKLGRDDIVRLLTTNLNEEKAADKKLSTVALRKGVNRWRSGWPPISCSARSPRVWLRSKADNCATAPGPTVASSRAPGAERITQGERTCLFCFGCWEFQSRSSSCWSCLRASVRLRRLPRIDQP